MSNITDEDRVDPEFIKSKTINFIIVPKNQYADILVDDHIRYIADGLFKLGGWVTAKRMATDNREYWVIRLAKQKSNYTTNGRGTYILYTDRITTLWKEMSGLEIDLLRRSIDLKQEYIKDIAVFLLGKFGAEFSDHMNVCEKKRSSH
jgi:hypothetical protein